MQKVKEVKKVKLVFWWRNFSFHGGFVALDTFQLTDDSCYQTFHLRLPSHPRLPPHIHPLHTRNIPTHWWHKKTAFWWINLYILEPIPVSASILQRPCLLLSWAPLQPNGVISLLAVLNSLIICVLHKKRTIPQWHTTACSAWLGLALMCKGCCVCTIGLFRLSFSIPLWRWDKMSVFLL